MAESDDLVAVIVHREALDDRHPDETGLSQDGEFVLGDGRVERSTPLLPVRNELRQS